MKSFYNIINIYKKFIYLLERACIESIILLFNFLSNFIHLWHGYDFLDTILSNKIIFQESVNNQRIYYNTRKMKT